VIAGQQGRVHKALDLIGHAAALAPTHPMIQADHARALHRTGNTPAALVVLEGLLTRLPAFASGLECRGQIWRQQGRLEEALADFDRVLAQNAEAGLLFQTGALLEEMDRADKALERYDGAVALDPDHHEARIRRGWLRMQAGRFEAALADVLYVTGRAPHLAGAQFNLGLYHLLQGDFAKGLPLYDWRMQLPGQNFVKIFPQARWTGREDLHGKTLLVHAEQGMGDVIQFCRFLLPLKDRGARICFALSRDLHRLLQSAGLPATLCQTPPRDVDFQIPLMSLPLALGTRLDTIPQPAPLAAEPERIACWRQRLGNDGFRIGLCWRGGSEQHARDKRFALAALAPLARLPGIRWISLQKGDAVPELDRPPPEIRLEAFDDLDAGPDAFIDTAAIMANCKLVISADSAPAHLAGSLGVPCWLALKHVPDWRWLLKRPDTPWYGSVRLFRQPARGDWDGVFAAMAQELAPRL
jgi:tetratricopeptide (TPR) repeat protein